MRVFDSSPTHWGIDEYDLANQGLISHHFELVDGRFERDSLPFRYTWPAELDLMAELAGLRLHERWSGWLREPFRSDSRKHVSVWEKPAAQGREIAVARRASARAGFDVMVPESKLAKTEHGLAPEGGGWYVLNMRDAEWRHADGRGAVCVVADDFEGWRRDADQLGVNPFVLMPGEPMAMYHGEQTRGTSSWSRAMRSSSSKARSGGCVRGTSYIARRARARDRRGRKRSVPRDRGGRSRA